MPQVSVLIPAYQAQDTISAAVTSVRAQDFEDWELVIASDDGLDYLALCRAAGLADPRLRQTFTIEPRSGPSVARNRALAVAGGRFIAPLDADDTWQPVRLSRLLPLATRHGVAVDNVAVMEGENRLLRRAFPELTKGEEAGLSAARIMLCGVPLQPLVAREIAASGWREEVGFAEDVIFNLEVLSRAGGYAVVGDSLSHYRLRPDSLSNGPDACRLADDGYHQILADLAMGAFDLTAEIRREAQSLFLQKKATNKAFETALRAGRCASFQEFLALGGDH